MVLKNNFYVIKLKRNFFPILFLCFTFCLLLFSKSNLPAVKSGLSLWVNSVIPSLFPFFVATELLMHTNIVTILGNILNKYMKPIFNIRGEGCFAFIMGIISGYPVGAKIASQFRENNICSKEECERLLSFTNNSGPLFIIGTVGILMFKNTTIGILLFITHLLACISVGIIFRFWKKNQTSKSYSYSDSYNNNKINSVSFSNLGEVLAESITSSISTVLLIGGFVVIFSSIISILKSSGILIACCSIVKPMFYALNIDTSFIMPLLTGFLEITNGISSISNIACKKISINIILSAFLLGFGGISVLLQVLSITSKTDLSIKPYIYGKILQGFLAAFYTYICMNIFPFLNFDL
ncbi:MAG: sporulation integral membrane protein YlbJ [Clostridia bacterium]|nr:sporulation integral membrane protein YlbJ [Clostridia bacterium]